MQNFRIMFFQGGMLEEYESLEAESALQVVQGLSGHSFSGRIEVWAEDKRVAVVRSTNRMPRS